MAAACCAADSVIHLLFTGGTISMQFDAVAGGNVPAHAGEALLALAPDASAIAPCRVENWARIPACHLTQVDHWRLRQRVGELMQAPEVQGIVVTHGTDTLEETCLLYTSPSPRDRSVSRMPSSA